MTPTRRCATALAAGPLTHPTCGYPVRSARSYATGPPEARTQSPGARLRAAADPAATVTSAEPVNSRTRPGLRKTWTWAVHSPRVAR